MKIESLNWLALFTVFLTVFILCGCTSGQPRKFVVNGKTVVQTNKKFCGVPVWTKTEEVKTKEQKLDDLEIEKETREQDLDLKTEERQSAAAFWFGAILLGLAPICVIVGYVSKGWKFWGILAGLCGLLGAAFWSFEHLVPMLKWPAYILGIAAIMWTMWKFKNFSLAEKLKDSKPGKLI